MPAGRDEAAEFVSTAGIRDRVGGFRVIFSTRYPSIRWHRSRLVKTPEATIASYFSRDIRYSGEGTHPGSTGATGTEIGPGVASVDISVPPSESSIITSFRSIFEPD